MLNLIPNCGTWQAMGLRVLWFGGLCNPDVINQGCEVVLENARSFKPVKGIFDDVVLVLTPRDGSRMREYRSRPILGKQVWVFATDNLSAIRGLAQVVIEKTGLQMSADALTIPTERA
jgi:hypothetical protein